MKKILLFLLFGSILSVGIAQNCKPDFTGFYYYKISDDNSAVLRFFENGEVIATTSSNKYDEVETYFTLERKDLMLHGKYKWKKCKSSFKVKGDTGEQHYNVEKKGENMVVTITDKGSGKTVTQTYSFYNLTK
ncbi:MAG: hypothetical protein IAF38_00215 [Bacteroidia bacterium]|nr:hypothetical protein [Bacteroidia bacterium]